MPLQLHHLLGGLYWLLLAIQDLEIEQIDFIGAFLNAGVDFDIYMRVPEGLYEYSLSNPSARTLLKKHGWDPTKDQVILLKKSLYGLKQSPLSLATEGCSHCVKSLGYQPLPLDLATYYNSQDRIFIISHVDDCLLIGPSIQEITGPQES